MPDLKEGSFIGYPDGREKSNASYSRRVRETSVESRFQSKKMRMTPVLVMVSFMLMMSGVAATSWNYENQDEWGGFCNSGIKQSPLNFMTVSRSSFPPFEFKNYGLINTSLEIENNHLKVNLEPLPHNRPYLLGGGLSGKYVLDSFHFHWGSSNDIGSEHRLLDCSFAGEIHFVHYKEGYRSVEEARNTTDGVAVLTVWLQAPVTDNDDAFQLPEGDDHDQESETFHAASTNHWLLDLLPNGPFVEGSRGRTFLRHLLPWNVHSFYRYQGSLTTPPCSPTLVWTVFRNTVYAPRRLLRFLRSLKNPSRYGGENSRYLSNNFRNIQEKGGRTVYFSGRPERHFAECDNDL